MDGIDRGLEAKAIEIKLEMAKLNNGGQELTVEQRQKVIEGAIAMRAASRASQRPQSTIHASRQAPLGDLTPQATGMQMRIPENQAQESSSSYESTDPEEFMDKEYIAEQAKALQDFKKK